MRRKERPLPWLRYLIEAMADQECGASQDGFIRHSFRDRVQIFLVGADARLSSQIKTTSAQTNGAGHHSSEGWLFASHLTIVKPTQCNLSGLGLVITADSYSTLSRSLLR